FPLGRLLQQERRATLGAGLGDRLVPKNEVTVGILQAAVEDLPAFRPAFDEFAAASRFRTRDADSLRFDVLALWIIPARNELTETPFFEHELGLAALRACFIERHVRLFR